MGGLQQKLAHVFRGQIRADLPPQREDTGGKVTYLSDLKPVSAKQGYDVLHAHMDIDKRPLEYSYGPYTKPIRIVAEVDGRKVEFQQAGGPEAYEHTFDGFDAGEHLIRLQITDGQSPITQHELVTVQVEQLLRTWNCREPLV